MSSKENPFGDDAELLEYLQIQSPLLLGSHNDEETPPATANEVARRIAGQMTQENRRLAAEVKRLAGELGFTRGKLNRKELPTLIDLQIGKLTIQLSILSGTGLYKGNSRGFGIAGEPVSSVVQIQQTMRESYRLNTHLAEVVVPHGVADKPADVHLPAIAIEAQPEIPRSVLELADSLIPSLLDDKALVLAFDQRLSVQEGNDRLLTYPAEWKCVPRNKIKDRLSREAIFLDRIYLRR